MKEGISVDAFLDSKKIELHELRDNFTLVRTFQVNIHNHEKGCIYCKNTANQREWPSGAWTSVKSCSVCDSIILTIWTDRMGGSREDTVMVFQQKNKPKTDNKKSS